MGLQSFAILERVLEALSELIGIDTYALPVTGPRAWWAGPLNLEAVAAGSVRCALSAANAVSPGSVPSVSSERIAANFGSLSHLRIDGRKATSFAPMSRFFRCADGWMRTHANFPHHAEALRRALGVEDAASLQAALAGGSAMEAESLIRAAGGVAAAVRTREDWLASPAGRASSGGPWIGFRPGDRDQQVRLQGLRVLDLTRVIAGPTATKFLAALGADVLRIDPPHLPELLDHHLDTNAGKRTALVDLSDATALAHVRELIATADVIMLGYRNGALEHFGLGADELHAAHPNLAIVKLDAWGDQGPWASERGFDSIVQAATGIAHAYRRPDGSPGALPVQGLDHATGYGAAAAALALLRRGGVAHVSLVATANALFHSGPAEGPALELNIPTTELDTPHGRLRQVLPLIGDPQPPDEYGTAAARWR